MPNTTNVPTIGYTRIAGDPKRWMMAIQREWSNFYQWGHDARNIAAAMIAVQAIQEGEWTEADRVMSRQFGDNWSDIYA